MTDLLCSICHRPIPDPCQAHYLSGPVCMQCLVDDIAPVKVIKATEWPEGTPVTSGYYRVLEAQGEIEPPVASWELVHDPHGYRRVRFETPRRWTKDSPSDCVDYDRLNAHVGEW